MRVRAFGVFGIVSMVLIMSFVAYITVWPFFHWCWTHIKK